MPSRPLLLVGLMSGTSADGVDAALVHVSGMRRPKIQLRAWVHQPFSARERQLLLDACSAQGSSAAGLCVLHGLLAQVYAEAARRVARRAGVALRSVDALCAHGQTVWHQPEPVLVGSRSVRSSLQLGSAPMLAQCTGCTVVSDFRAADIAAGGQGAPLVPFADWALFGSHHESRAVLNIGGIANLTLLPRAARLGEVTAFDTGPGNMVLDGLVRLVTNGVEHCDRDGRRAARGRPHAGILQWMHGRAEAYLRRRPPKSTGRELFGEAFAGQLISEAARLAVAEADLLATATLFTVETIALGLREGIHVQRLIVGGGGARNPVLMRLLEEHVRPVPVDTLEQHGIPSEAKEAIAFALLGHQTLLGRPANIPAATGARRRVVLGTITPGRRASMCAPFPPAGVLRA